MKFNEYKHKIANFIERGKKKTKEKTGEIDLPMKEHRQSNHWPDMTQ